jgi:hypothetical protein|uniref:Uncharacterized protein ycf88 n=1 Tax=Trieres chinensis TaxID=1514140 RepID=YCF88_TRICV|nr:ORF148 [Trieres chinensis]YP_010537368.1 hypothetical protein ycf88 [Odontella regia]P49829.1 RecName: Full=Uncharacterized protein ycf88; AltName: Full=ORF148 [Trieres chinensis]UYC31155.1 hypothetical protein ycf88 [Odontella regia]CAA91644.1 ORF148 [Trieres chinensis]
MNISSLIEDGVYPFEKDKVKQNYQKGNFEPIFQTFNVKYDKTLSARTKLILKTWKGKAFYYVNEDILYLLNIDQVEQDFLLKILHSMGIFLQNATSASFFDIYIYDINITEVPYYKSQKLENGTLLDSLTFTLKCYVTPPPEKPEIPW